MTTENSSSNLPTQSVYSENNGIKSILEALKTFGAMIQQQMQMFQDMLTKITDMLCRKSNDGY
jgi:hypothetical protein